MKGEGKEEMKVFESVHFGKGHRKEIEAIRESLFNLVRYGYHQEVTCRAQAAKRIVEEILSLDGKEWARMVEWWD